jgi:hypothetical protein
LVPIGEEYIDLPHLAEALDDGGVVWPGIDLL